MLKKSLSLLLIMAMLLSMNVFTTAHAEEVHPHDAENYDHCVCGNSAAGVHDHVCESITWTALPEGTTDFGTLESGNYYLTGDVAVTKASSIGSATEAKELNICLNGYNITSTSTRVFGYIYKDTVFSICDCSGTQDVNGDWTWGGTVTAGEDSNKYGCVLYTYAMSTVNIYGGNFTSLSTKAINGSVFVVANDKCDDLDGDGDVDETDKCKPASASTLNIYNGYIYGSTTTTGHGGLISCYHYPIMNIHGGVITGGRSDTFGGNIRCNGELYITGGTITNGYAGKDGGNIYSEGKLVMTGGTVTGGSAVEMGGGIYADEKSSANISGNVVIDGNDHANMYFYFPGTYTIGQLEEDAKIGIHYRGGKYTVTIAHSPAEDVLNYIYSDSIECYFEITDGKMKQQPYDAEYEEKVRSLDYFDNTLDEALPMTVVHKLMMDHFTSELPEGKTEKKAILIGYDAFRTDALEVVKDQDSGIFSVAEDGGLYHAFAGGIKGTAKQQQTITSCGWTSMFTGYWFDGHGIVNNGYTANPGIYGYNTLLAEMGYSVYNLGTSGMLDTKNESFKYTYFFPARWAAEVDYQKENNLDITYTGSAGYAEDQAAMISLLEGEEIPDVIWYYQGYTDTAGHTYDWGNHVPEYVDAVNQVDGNGYDVYQTIKNRSTYDQEDWLVIVTTDHGGYLNMHYQQNTIERSIWIASNKTIDYTDAAYAEYDRIELEEQEHTHCACAAGAVEIEGHTCENETWQPWYDDDALPTAAGNYYLVNDVDLTDITDAYTLGEDVQQKICLNGHKITGSADCSIWSVANYLSICDCAGTGTIDTYSTAVGALCTVSSASAVSDGVGGTFEIFGGTVTANAETSGSGGLVYVGSSSGTNKATFNMYGGVLQGASATGSGGAVNIYATNAVMNMYGGMIQDCSSGGVGGAVRMGGTSREFNMYGGTIQNCTSVTAGGNVYSDGGNVTIYDGTITGGECDKEGGNLGVYSNGILTMYGGTVSDGTATNNGGNIMLWGTGYFYGGQISNGSCGKYGGNLCAYNALSVTIGKTEESTSAPTFSGGTSGTSGGSICVRGASSNTRVTQVDILDGALITGGVAPEGGNIAITKTSYVVNMYGGEISNGGNSTTTTQGGNVMNHATFNMYGGTIKDGTSKSNGGNVSGYNSFVFNMAKSDKSTTVPTISGGTSGGSGGNMILRGTAPVLNMSYGIITGGTGSSASGVRVSKGTVNLSGTAQIIGNNGQNLSLASGLVLNASDLEEGAAFGITMSATTGVFAEETDAACLSYFTADNAALMVVAADNTLSLVKAAAQKNGQRYTTLTEALSNTDSGYIQLLNDVAENVEITSDTYLDLNGCVLTGDITGEGTLYGMDSATDGYTMDTMGRITGTVSCNVEPYFKTSLTGSVRRYLAIKDDSGYTFHRFYLGITHMSLRPGSTGVGYKAVFCGDEQVQEQVAGYGYTLWIGEDGQKISAGKDGAFTSGETVSLLLKNFDVANYGETKVYGQVYITLSDGTTIVSAEYGYTLRSLLETVAADLTGYSQTQLEALKTMVEANADAMAEWDIASILNYEA